jgi:PAS domain S-box-containing protein
VDNARLHRAAERARAGAVAARGDAEQSACGSARWCCRRPAPLALVEGPEHRFVLVNDAYKRVSGGGRDVTGLTPAHGVPELAGSGVHELFDRVYATGEPWEGPETLVRYDRDGTGVQDTWFNLRFEPLHDADGRVTGVFNFAVDVTDQVRARHEVERLLADAQAARAEAEAARAEAEASRATLAESESKFRFALDVADLGAWDLDMATQRAWRSPRHDQIFGYDVPLREWTYEHFLAHVVPEDRARVDAAFGGALAAGAAWDFTCRIRRADGQERWIAARGEPIADAAGAPVRLIGVVQDVTAERQAEAALRGGRGGCEGREPGEERVPGVMSHELRTPLNAIGGYAELMEMGIRGPVTAQQREDLGRIQRSQRHLLGLVNEVLNYARLESGTVQYDLQDVPVRGAVVDAEGLILPQARAKGLALVVADCPDAADGRPLAVRADPEKLRQVLVNLLSNAIKFTNVRDGLPGRIEVTCESGPDGRVRIRVRDTGIGISGTSWRRSSSRSCRCAPT